MKVTKLLPDRISSCVDISVPLAFVVYNNAPHLIIYINVYTHTHTPLNLLHTHTDDELPTESSSSESDSESDGESDDESSDDSATSEEGDEPAPVNNEGIIDGEHVSQVTPSHKLYTHTTASWKP